MITRDRLPAPKLPEEEVFVEAFGDTVRVRGLPLSFALNTTLRQDWRLSDSILDMLNRCVLAADDEPVYSVEEWDNFAATHNAEVMSLVQVIQRLSGMTQAANEKNSTSQP